MHAFPPLLVLQPLLGSEAVPPDGQLPQDTNEALPQPDEPGIPTETPPDPSLPEVPIEGEVPSEVEVPIKDEVPVEVEVPSEVEVPITDEVPVEVEVPAEVPAPGASVEVVEVASPAKVTSPEKAKSKETTPQKEDPPLVLRTEQWAKKPKAAAKAKGRAKGKAKAKPKAKSKGRKAKDDVEVIESEDEPAEGANNKSNKRKEPANTRKPKAKAARKSKAKGDEAEEEVEKTEKKDPPIKYQPVTNVGKEDLESAFKWTGPEGIEGEQGVGGTSQFPEPDTVSSFARRPMPKTSPAKEKWCAIVGSFDYHIAEWLLFYGLPIYSFEASSCMNTS